MVCDGSVAATTIDVPVNGWFMINAKQMFFYRVNYDLATRRDIVNQLITDHKVSLTTDLIKDKRRLIAHFLKHRIAIAEVCT